MAQLFRFFFQLGKDAVDIGPVEAALVRPPAQFGGFEKRGERSRNTVERRGVRQRLFCVLDGVPVAQHLGRVDIPGLQGGFHRVAGGQRGLVSENVRVAPDQLAVEPRDHIRDGEVARLAGHLRIKEDLQQ